MMPKVLCVSFDKTVSDQRAALLKKNGYNVTSTSWPDEAMRCLCAVKYDLVILGHRLAWSDRRDLAHYAREKCETPVVLVCGATRDSEIPADVRVYAIEGMDGLLEAVEKLLPVEKKVAA